METRQFTGVLALILLILPSVHLQSDEDIIVIDCIHEAEEFAEKEKFTKFRKPPLLGKDIKSFQRVVYEKGLRQRPFECISREIENNPGLDILASTKYQELVAQCEAERTQITCDPDRRTLDGTCNNLSNKEWGSLFVCLKRLLPQNYDGPSGLRKSVCGGPLPDPRKISLAVHEDQDQPLPDITHLHTFFGQFLAHDVTDVPNSFVCDKPIDCCTSSPHHKHPQCAAIKLEVDDPFYKDFDKTCLEFTRTAPCDTCSVGKRNQINQATSYIDLSATYGLTDDLAQCLRADDWKLKTQDDEKLMPVDCKSGICGSIIENERCFLAGDRRVNEQTHLMNLHTLFVREHNRLVKALRDKFPGATDDFIFEYARDINIAQMQVIVYNEFLPILLGPAVMANYNLELKASGCTNYDSSVDATIFAEFNTAAFRLHSMINGMVTHIGVADPDERKLRNIFGESGPLYDGRVGALLQGISRSSAQANDRFITEDLTNFLYKTRKEIFGKDLASFNIQRGRDNGLPTYVDVVKFITGNVINDFNDLDALSLMSVNSVTILQSTYCDVKDIDLWVGLLNEEIPNNMLVGPTTADLIARQFKNLKEGDRFFFEHCITRFNNNQLDELRKVTMSSLICQNTDVLQMQLSAMKFPTILTPLESCDVVPKLDLTVF